VGVTVETLSPSSPQPVKTTGIRTAIEINANEPNDLSSHFGLFPFMFSPHYQKKYPVKAELSSKLMPSPQLEQHPIEHF
jgi:hypothetical protein